MDNAKLGNRLREDRFDGFRKALQAIDADNEYIFDAAIIQLSQNRQPELCAFIFRRPKSESLLFAVRFNADC